VPLIKANILCKANAEELKLVFCAIFTENHENQFGCDQDQDHQKQNFSFFFSLKVSGY
jgi:hypothetical protein